MMLQRLSVFFLLTAFSFVSASDKSESDLRRALFENYDRLVRPVEKASDVIPVTLNLIPLGIRDVDVKDREIKLDTGLYLRWEDHHMRWDTAEYGIDHLSLPADQVWRPDIALYSAVSDEKFFPTTMSNVYIWSNGTVAWVPPFTVKSRCPPTDNQITETTFQCTVSFGSWTYDVTMLDVQHMVDNPLSQAEGFDNAHPKWSLDSMSATSESKKYQCCDPLYSLIKFDLLFTKRSSTE